MPRYIDADELKESLKKLKAKGYNLKYVQGLQDAIDGYFPQIIDDAPTADVQPVKHGRWEHGECSVCGASPLDHVSGDMYVEVDYYPNYCPNCGSKNVDLWLDDDSVPNEDMRPDNESI